MFDTHVNLHGEAFQDDLEDVLTRARAAGISRFLTICDRFDNFPAVHAIAQANSDIWCSAGVHPHHAKEFPDLRAEDLIEAAQSAKVVGIGETGLDYHYGYSPEADQVRSLHEHITAAQETGLPIILHTREADPQVIEILKARHAQKAFTPLLHCYTGGHDLAETGLSLGGYVSVSGILSFKNAHDVRDVISRVPMDRLILETDCPYLAPVPHRGRRNEPAYLSDVGAALARLFDMDPGAVARVTEANARRLFWRVDA
ncbi:MAG: TatD family hydrolase [Hyphomonadaceae bacterium]|nr:TatD family hydrolase [Hyphomonadaceae bacterium]